MTRDFQDMLYLLGYCYRSQTGDKEHEYNVEKIKELSISQGVWTLVFPELEKYADLKEHTDEFMKTVMLGIKENTFQLSVISEMNAAGLKACLLKGAAVALAYPDPSMRISGDTDILIKPEQEREVMEFLWKRGYKIKLRSKNDHHFKAYHNAGGMLEGHVRLYSIPTEKILLDGMELYDEEWTEEEIEGYTIPVLGLNDGLIYLTAHYIKHLVNEGGGVRQMLDLLLYIERYRDRLDFDRYDRVLKELRYDKLIDVIKTIGAKYWGFDYPLKYEEQAEEILTDSEAGGIFGYDTNEREGFYKLYCSSRAKKPGAKLTTFIKGERDWKRRLFPKRTQLVSEGFKGADKAILYPYYLFRHFLKKYRSRKEKAESPNLKINKRLEMMKELGMVV